MTIKECRLPLPAELLSLLDDGVWPTRSSGSGKIRERIDRSAIARMFPDERDVFFYPGPFKTVEEEVELGVAYWAMPEAALHQLDPRKSVVIGDFGQGSDTALLLDYRKDIYCPSVIKLEWASENPKENNRWVTVSESFGEFCRSLGLLS